MVCICLDISINAFCKKIHLDSYYRRGYIRLILFTKVSLYDWTQVYCSLSKLCSTVYLCISPEFGISNYFKFLYLLEEGGGEEALKQSEDSVGCVWSSADVLGSIWWGGEWTFLYWHWPTYSFGIALWINPVFLATTSLLQDALLCSNGYGFCWFSLNSVTISRFSRGFLLLLVFQTCFRYKRPKYRDFKGLELQLQQ